MEKKATRDGSTFIFEEPSIYSREEIKKTNCPKIRNAKQMVNKLMIQLRSRERNLEENGAEMQTRNEAIHEEMIRGLKIKQGLQKNLETAPSKHDIFCPVAACSTTTSAADPVINQQAKPSKTSFESEPLKQPQTGWARLYFDPHRLLEIGTGIAI